MVCVRGFVRDAGIIQNGVSRCSFRCSACVEGEKGIVASRVYILTTVSGDSIWSFESMKVLFVRLALKFTK